ncbi:hypothetical protein [Kaistella montana]|uniref:Carboxypeptidase-like regulatory domain-containing protein n=1 Tax=Kaistella montana TaxID=1849733 RepID=A0ABW5KA42_9FLAO|nr:hypothetical protein [Kaistella montana]MCQ4036049.1 hypothetical protein [Kaistella montana]
MKPKLLLLLLLFCSSFLFSQEFIFGKVSTELGDKLPAAVVINMRTDEKILSDRDGNFMITAKNGDEIRVLKNTYERFVQKVTAENFSKPLNVSLSKAPYLIEEIELAFQATGNLKKDVKSLDLPKKVVALNSSMGAYMRSPMTEVVPKLSTPSAFAQPNLNAGQADLLKLASAVSSLFNKATQQPLTKANYAETQEFYRRIKTTMDLSFYTQQGWDEEEIDRFLIYADRTYQLAKKYRKSFDVAQISSEMKMAFKEYIKTRNVKSSPAAEIFKNES